MNSKIMKALIERLEADGPERWTTIARRAGCASTRLPAKIVYGSRSKPPERVDPRIETIEPLLLYYGLVFLDRPPRRRRSTDVQAAHTQV